MTNHLGNIEMRIRNIEQKIAPVPEPEIPAEVKAEMKRFLTKGSRFVSREDIEIFFEKVLR